MNGLGPQSLLPGPGRGLKNGLVHEYPANLYTGPASVSPYLKNPCVDTPPISGIVLTKVPSGKGTLRLPAFILSASTSRASFETSLSTDKKLKSSLVSSVIR